MEQFVQYTTSWIGDTSWERLLGAARAVFIFFDVALVIAFVPVFLKALEHRPKFSLRPERARKKKIVKDPKIIEGWRVILERSVSNPPQSLVWAIVEADKFTDGILKKLNLPGEHMADRLEKLGSWELRSIDGVWRAHRVRNELVHQPDYNISPSDAKEVLRFYEEFLKELQLI